MDGGGDGANDDGRGGGALSLIAETTGVSLIPSFSGSDREMRGLFSRILLPLPLACGSLYFSLHFQQSLLSATRSGALSPAHKGHSLHIFCFSNYKIHEKLKQS